MTCPSAHRAALAAALFGLAALTVAAEPTSPPPTSAPTVPSAPVASPPEEAVRLQPVRLVYRQIEGTYLKGPRGVFVDLRRGEVYVADTMNDLVAIYDRDGLPLFAFGYNGEFKEPMKAVVDGRGRIYVLAGVGRKLKVFTYRGEYLHDFAFPGAAGKPVPTALGADAGGDIYVADSTSGHILVYDSDERLRLQFGNEKSGDGRFQSVQAITVDRKGDIYVADAQGMPLQVFNREGKFIRGWGEHTAGPQNFSLPSGVAVDAAGRVIVADTIRQVVGLFTADGAFLARYGGLGFDPGAMAFPSDVATDGERRIYVVERVGARLQIFDEQTIASTRPSGGARQIPSGEREQIRRSLGDFMRNTQ